MPVLKILRGLPASGKSTEARRIVTESGNFGRINRDDLRKMIFNGNWSQKRESAIVDIEKAIAKVLFDYGWSALIDDTNLTDKHLRLWQGFAQGYAVEFQVQNLDTPIEECIERDARRTGSERIGKAIILRMAAKAGLIDWGSKDIAIVDVDGTIASGTHREHHLVGKKNWDAYFSEMDKDEPIDFVINWVKELAKDYTICIVSGRPDTYQFETMHWLWHHNVPYDYIFMRPGNSKEDDTVVKKNILDMLPKDKIKIVLDDRPKVVRMWKEQGLFCIPVRGAIEEF